MNKQLCFGQLEKSLKRTNDQEQATPACNSDKITMHHTMGVRAKRARNHTRSDGMTVSFMRRRRTDLGRCERRASHWQK